MESCISMKLVIIFSMLVAFTQVFAASLPDIIENTKKSVVAVGTYMYKRAPKGMFLGTGFAIGDGSLIVTNAHVIPEKLGTDTFESLAVFFKQGHQAKMLEAKILVVDKKHDIAVIKLSSGSFPALKLAFINSDSIREGQSIAFTGYPIGIVLGLFPVTHKGIISAISPIAIPMMKSRYLNTKVLKRLQQAFDVYQLDATAYPGNSGSPVYSAETGYVIGIINKVFVKESKENILSKPSGITYAIPIKYLQELLQKNKIKL